MPENSPVTIPETITVHLGAPSSYAENVTVPFPEYIKNVASSEIYPTWPEQAIRANVYVQVSYALNRVFTEWYRAQGYDFDITNSTQFDQSFVQGRDIFENISTIVDEMFNNYLTRGDALEPLFAQYCNGTTSTCPGGLSQWGTVPLAEQGMSAEDIVQYFYGNDIRFVQDAPVSPNLGGSWPGVTLRLGDVSEDVRTIQRRLNRISVNYPNIPKIYPIDGIFDKETERAVRTFQEQFNLVVDGLVGKATWYQIAFVYNNVKKLSELDSEGLRLEDISRQYPTELREGSTGEGVQMLQLFLAVVGAYYDQLPALPVSSIDGVFGPLTREAVEAYQRMMKLPVTGIVNQETWIALVSTYQSVLRARPLEEYFPEVAALNLNPSDQLFLVEGMRDSNVRALQEAINIIASSYTNIPTVAVDGIYGAATTAAVIEIQKMGGLSPTGAVGPATWRYIISVVREIQTNSRTAEGQYPGYAVGEGENV